MQVNNGLKVAVRWVSGSAGHLLSIFCRTLCRTLTGHLPFFASENSSLALSGWCPVSVEKVLFVCCPAGGCVHRTPHRTAKQTPDRQGVLK